jgi:hypothetical protein
VKNLIISPKIQEKLSKKDPPVTSARSNSASRIFAVVYLSINENNTKPFRRPFGSSQKPTNANRELKIVYVQEAGLVYLKSAFDPNDEERRIYLKHAC